MSLTRRLYIFKLWLFFVAFFFSFNLFSDGLGDDLELLKTSNSSLTENNIQSIDAWSFMENTFTPITGEILVYLFVYLQGDPVNTSGKELSSEINSANSNHVKVFKNYLLHQGTLGSTTYFGKQLGLLVDHIYLPAPHLISAAMLYSGPGFLAYAFNWPNDAENRRYYHALAHYFMKAGSNELLIGIEEALPEVHSEYKLLSNLPAYGSMIMMFVLGNFVFRESQLKDILPGSAVSFILSTGLSMVKKSVSSDLKPVVTGEKSPVDQQGVATEIATVSTFHMSAFFIDAVLPRQGVIIKPIVQGLYRQGGYATSDAIEKIVFMHAGDGSLGEGLMMLSNAGISFLFYSINSLLPEKAIVSPIFRHTWLGLAINAGMSYTRFIASLQGEGMDFFRSYLKINQVPRDDL